MTSDDVDFVSEGLYDLHDYAEEKKFLPKVEKCVKDALGSITPRVEIIEAINNVIPLGDADNLVWRQTESALGVFETKISKDQSNGDIVKLLVSQWENSDNDITLQFNALWKTTNQIWNEDHSNTIIMSLIKIKNQGEFYFI